MNFFLQKWYVAEGSFLHIQYLLLYNDFDNYIQHCCWITKSRSFFKLGKLKWTRLSSASLWAARQWKRDRHRAVAHLWLCFFQVRFLLCFLNWGKLSTQIVNLKRWNITKIQNDSRVWCTCTKNSIFFEHVCLPVHFSII